LRWWSRPPSVSVLRARCPCLLGVGFPASGPRVWSSTSCLLRLPGAPPSRRVNRREPPSRRCEPVAPASIHPSATCSHSGAR
jgi:hypothetical protein